MFTVINNQMDDKPYSDPTQEESLVKYYEGKSLFLTGVTGFIGQVILEKLLRACPGIEKIYVLLRPKKDLGCHERLQAVFKSPLFHSLMESDVQAAEKVIPVAGDISEENLGMTEEDWIRVSDDVNIIIHNAASVRFNQPLRVAMQMNCVAVRKVIQLARNTRNLSMLCYISTAYSQ